MWSRVIEKFASLYLLIRPAIFVFLAVTLLYAAYLLRDVHIAKPSRPLEKIINSAPVGDEEKYTDAEMIVVVSITGAVSKPGVYEFDSRESPRIKDLLDRAGGLNEEADHLYMAREVNLAAVLTSGQQIYVPAITERSLLSEQTDSDKVAANDRNSSININTASVSELETLPGVGPATAEKIIAGRPYDNINDITSVSGIGDATLAKIKDLITL